jgi:hypothetical protein
LKNCLRAGGTVSSKWETTWKNVVQKQGTHSELYFAFHLILIPCPGVKCKNGGITFQTPYLFIAAELLLQHKETSLETFKYNLIFLGVMCCIQFLLYSSNSGQITGIQEKLNATCK